MSADLRKQIRNRLAELKAEQSALEKALAALEGVGSGAGRRGRPRGSTSAKTVKRRSRRGGTRADQALKVLQANPGMRVAEIAKEVGIPPNYMYRVMNELKKDKRVRKQGKGYVAA